MSWFEKVGIEAMLRIVLVISIAAALTTGSAVAQTEPALQSANAQDQTTSTLAAWDSFAEELHQLGSKMMARLPDRLRNDPQVQQEAGRLLLEAVAAKTIEAIGSDGDHPVFLPALNITLNVFQPNADTTYRNAVITPGGTYRLRGERGSLRILKMGQFGPTPAKATTGISAFAYNDFNALHVDEAGRFDVVLSPTKPAGYTGDWWQLSPTASSLLLRQVDFDWKNERDPRISIERLDKPVERPRPSAADLDRRLRGLATAIGNAAFFLVDHVEGLRRDGYINRLKEFDVSKLGGLVGQFYYEGAYELSPDEALIVEAKVPDKCTYWSVILTNEIYETTDWYNNQSSLNGSQARVDSDGVLRVVVSAKDPGVPNWLDTAGYPSGAIQGRWTECAATPIPTVRKVPFTDVRQSLPRDTPTVTAAQREEAVRDRRAQLQERPLW
jgi:Protein of unknown function (DUF1214)